MGGHLPGVKSGTRIAEWRRMFAKVLPFMALAAALFGGIFIFIGYESAAGGARWWGVAIGIFGLLGVVLAVALWRLGRRLAEPSRRP